MAKPSLRMFKVLLVECIMNNICHHCVHENKGKTTKSSLWLHHAPVIYMYPCTFGSMRYLAHNKVSHKSQCKHNFDSSESGRTGWKSDDNS